MQFLQPKPLFIVLLLMSIALLFGVDSFKENIARVLINKTLNAPTVAATERQQQLARAAQLLGPPADSVPESGMILAILQGIANLRTGKTAVAAKWFQAAAEAVPQPNFQQAIWVSPWMSIEKDGSLAVSGNSTVWRTRPDTQKSGTIQSHQDGSATFKCQPSDELDRAAFEWIQPFTLTFHQTVQIEAWVATGTVLILETRIDGQLERLMTISGTNQWQTVEAPVIGSSGQLIYLIVAQNPEKIDSTTCHVRVRAIRFLLDRVYGNQ